MGESNTLEQRVEMTAGRRLDPDELAALNNQIAALRDLVAAHVPAERRDDALQNIDEIKAATAVADKTDPGRLSRAYGWFLDNAPDLAGSVAALLLGPLVGKLVGGGAGAMAAALRPGDANPQAGAH